MKKQIIIPDPEDKLNIIRRYLHILALLQVNEKDIKWNGQTLSEILWADEQGEGPSDKAIRDYINKHLKKELELPVDIRKGSREISLSGPIESAMLERIAGIYSLFVVSDTSRDDVLKSFIKNHPDDCLWLLARIYFAKLRKKRIKFDYTANSGYQIKECLANPYYMVIRNNNLYLVARIPGKAEPWLFIANRIENLKVTDQEFDEEIPPLDIIFKDTLGSFLGEKYRVTLRFDKDIRIVMEQILGILEPEITPINDGNQFEARFSISDDRYLCKQLFLYGNKVEILEPKELRDLMVEMLKESMGVYKQ